VQADEWVVAKIEVFDAKIGSLLSTRAGVVEEEDEDPVPQSQATVARQVVEEILHFVAFKESRLCRSHTLHRHGRHALAHDEHFWCSPSDVLEQAVHGGQALIARTNVVPPVNFEMLEKADDPFEREVAKCKARDLAMLVSISELKGETDRVAVAAYRGGTQTLDGDQVVDEERMQEWSQ
jgi:hypothetical protein